MSIDVYVLWGFRLGIVLIFLGILIPNKNRKTILSKAIRRNTTATFTPQNGIVKYLDKVTENDLLRNFMLKEDSDDYAKLDALILQAGGLGGLTPNIVQLFRIVLPPVAFVIALITYLIKTSISTVTLNPSQLQQMLDASNAVSGFLQASPAPAATTSTTGGVSWIAIMWIFILSLVLYILPEMIIKNRIKARRKIMAKELPVMETFIVIMLESGTHTVYDILKTLLDTTTFFKPYITMCLNEYYVDPKRAIQNMADRINDEEFQIICNSLKQAVDMDKKYTVTFMKQHIDQIRRLQDLQREAAIKKKPLMYVFLLALPLINIVVIWFYPWFTKAMKMLTTGF